MKIRFAVTPPASAFHEDAFVDYLETCERLGFDTVWLSDVPLGPFGDPLLSLTYAAACTRKLKLGANIVPLGRHPLWLAKQLAQLDRLSHGRLLLSFVPGLGQPAERAALGYTTGDRGRVIDDMIALMRRWWAGEAVTASFGQMQFDDIRIAPTSLQQPLEIWLGGAAPAALERVARLADGWLTSAVTPAEAAQGRHTIETRARELGRSIDGEHFGISMPVAAVPPPETALTALRQRRADRDLSGVLAIGRDGLRTLVQQHLDGGISKFVLRPATALDERADWRSDLAWYADTVLPLQT